LFYTHFHHIQDTAVGTVNSVTQNDDDVLHDGGIFTAKGCEVLPFDMKYKSVFQGFSAKGPRRTAERTYQIQGFSGTRQQVGDTVAPRMIPARLL